MLRHTPLIVTTGKLAMKTKILLTLLALLLIPTTAMAVPALQLYADGATFNPKSGAAGFDPNFSEETWVAGSSDFTLYVVGAEGRYKYIDNTYLLVSVQAENYNGGNGTITIKGKDGEASDVQAVSVALNSATATYGTPGGMSGHGVFDAYSWWVSIPELLGNTTEPIQNYSPDSINDPAEGEGEIQLYDVSIEGFALAHFDLVGRGWKKTKCGWKTDCLKAPFSHDVEGPGDTPDPRIDETIPEPATMTLFGITLIGIGIYRRKRRA
jgi:PEP-CTERM motif